MGAKGKYAKWLLPDNLLRLQAWARDGLSDEQMAHNIGITTTTLYDWKKKYPAFSEALARGKEVVDIEVENALLKRAKGYDYIETTSELIADKNARNKAVMKVTKRVTRHVPPDVKALIFWLTNRKPEWRDKQEKELSGNIGVNLVVDDDISADD